MKKFNLKKFNQGESYYAYAHGYYDGRTQGTYNLPENYQAFYKAGYDRGLGDYCDYDITGSYTYEDNNSEDQLTLALQSVNNADTLLKQTKVGADFSVAFNILTKEE